ncbi:hypothetical protein L873DRAFT_1814978, partial [Choiromyces venosus 120613-1]
MSDRNYGGEDHPDLSGDTLTEFSLQKRGDIPSQKVSPFETCSTSLTPRARGVHGYGGTGLVSTKRWGSRNATAEAVKQSASGAGASTLSP